MIELFYHLAVQHLVKRPRLLLPVPLKAQLGKPPLKPVLNGGLSKMPERRISNIVNQPGTL